MGGVPTELVANGPSEAGKASPVCALRSFVCWWIPVPYPQDNHKFHANLGYRVKVQDNGGYIVSDAKPRGKMELKVKIIVFI